MHGQYEFLSSSPKRSLHRAAHLPPLSLPTQALKAMIWMHSQYEPVDELKSSLLGELSDPEWPAPLLNGLLVTMHARFKVRRGVYNGQETARLEARVNSWVARPPPQRPAGCHAR